MLRASLEAPVVLQSQPCVQRRPSRVEHLAELTAHLQLSRASRPSQPAALHVSLPRAMSSPQPQAVVRQCRRRCVGIWSRHGPGGQGSVLAICYSCSLVLGRMGEGRSSETEMVSAKPYPLQTLAESHGARH